MRGAVIRVRDGGPFSHGVILAIGKTRYKEHIPVMQGQSLQPKVLPDKMEVLIAFTRILADYTKDSKLPLIEVSRKRMTVKRVMSTMEVYREGKNSPFRSAA